MRGHLTRLVAEVKGEGFTDSADGVATRQNFTTVIRMRLQVVPPALPQPPRDPEVVLGTLLDDGVTWGDSEVWLPALPDRSSGVRRQFRASG